MSVLPPVISIELEEEDVQEDLNNILTAMEHLRQEQLQNNIIPEDRKEEYLHLAFRLSSAIEGLIDVSTDINLINDMETVVKSLEENTALLNYDYLQNDYWNEEQPEFSKKLDSILIRLKQDDFTDLSEKHHIINGLKYLASKDEPLEKRLEIYDTITPFNDNSKIKNKNLFKKISRYGYDSMGLILKVGKTNNVKQLLTNAATLGFKFVQVPMEVKEYDNNKIKGRVISADFVEDLGNPFLKKLIKYTAPISYPLIGTLPRRLVNKIVRKLSFPDYYKKINLENIRKKDTVICKNRYDDGRVIIESGAKGDITEIHDKNHITIKWDGLANEYADIKEFNLEEETDFELRRNTFKDWLPFASSLAVEAGLVGYMFYNIAGLAKIPPLIGVPLGLLIIDIAKRGVQYANNSDYGSMITWPLKFFCFNEKKENKVMVEFDVSNVKSDNSETKVEKIQNMQEILENAAQYKVDEKFETNLRWNLENHHTQCKYFAKEIKEKLNFEKDQIERELGCYFLYDNKKCGNFNKISALVCYSGTRYSLSFITENEFDITSICRTLKDDINEHKKFENIFNETNSDYMHLCRFENLEKTEDLSAKK
ncbi:hypothetical protein ACFL1H_07795 [Nanoarchaeota archaeon]